MDHEGKRRQKREGMRGAMDDSTEKSSAILQALMHCGVYHENGKLRISIGAEVLIMTDRFFLRRDRHAYNRESISAAKKKKRMETRL